MTQPRIIGLLSWYQEDPAWLERSITSIAPLLDHLVCMDGAYALFPDGQARSDLTNYEAIHRAAFNADVGLTIHTPSTTWTGNEVEKRTHLFRVAEQEAQPTDWYLVFDADEFATQIPEDVHQRLANSVFDVANCTLSEPHATGRRRTYPMPMLFRAIPGLHVHGNHFTYKTPDNRTLWGNVLTERLEPRISLDDLAFDHLTEFRHEDRRTAARSYYRIRDEENTEDFECSVNGCTNHAKHTMPWKWRTAQDGEGYAANWCAVCNDCRDYVANEGIKQLTELGAPDPEMLYRKKQWIAMPGPAPEPAAA